MRVTQTGGKSVPRLPYRSPSLPTRILGRPLLCLHFVLGWLLTARNRARSQRFARRHLLTRGEAKPSQTKVSQATFPASGSTSTRPGGVCCSCLSPVPLYIAHTFLTCAPLSPAPRSVSIRQEIWTGRRVCWEVVALCSSTCPSPVDRSLDVRSPLSFRLAARPSDVSHLAFFRLSVFLSSSIP